VRGHPALAQFHDEVPGIEAAVGSERDRADGRQPVEHRQRREPLGVAGGAGELGIDHQAVPVLHQHVPDEAELRLLAGTFAVQPGIGIGGRGVAVVGAPLAVEVTFLIPSLSCCRAPRFLAVAAARRVVRVVLGPEALHRRPRLDQAAVDAEVLAREQAADLRLIQNLGQKLGGDVAREQAIPVLREGRMIPDLIVDPEADEPAEQEVKVQPLHQLALRADRVQRLQQERPQQLFGRDRRSAHAGIEVMEARGERRQRVVDDHPDGPQRMCSRHPGLQIDVAE
jgi:hypothetical protein